jgi:hypothetical protein
MSNGHTAVMWEYLRTALERLPDANDPRTQADTVEVAFTGEGGPGAPPPHEPEEVVLEFRRERDPGGRLGWLWVFQGRIAFDRNFMADTPTHSVAAAWLQRELGPRCLEVELPALQGHVAEARVVAAPSPQPRAEKETVEVRPARRP